MTPKIADNRNWNTRKVRSGRVGALLLTLLVIFMLLAGLVPFDYRVPNGANWIKGGPGIGFSPPGIVMGGKGEASFPAVNEGAQGLSALSLEVVLRPSSLSSVGLPRIVSFANSKGKEGLFLGQWKDSLVWQEVDHTGLLAKTTNLIGTLNILDPSRTTVLTLVSSEKGTVLYADGKPAYRRSGLDFSGIMAEKSIGHIVLGNTPSGVGGWEGEIYGFSLINRKLDPKEISRRHGNWKSRETQNLRTDHTVLLYLLDEGEGKTVRNRGSAPGWDLEIPAGLSPLKREILALPTTEALSMRWFYADAAVNLAGFFPLGFILSLAFSRRESADTKVLIISGILFSGLLSLVIELSQSFLLSRDSSLTDLILNTTGGALGVLIFLCAFARFGKQRGLSKNKV